MTREDGTVSYDSSVYCMLLTLSVIGEILWFALGYRHAD